MGARLIDLLFGISCFQVLEVEIRLSEISSKEL